MPKSPKFDPVKEATESIASLDALCAALSITRSELAHAQSLPAADKYTRKETPKQDGSVRVVHNPHYLIRRIQRRINRRIFANKDIISWPDHVFGSIPNDEFGESVVERDYVNCAAQHCGAKSILSLDIKDFFDNIHRDRVVEIFQEFLKYPLDVANVLANICCKDDRVVQGALTSSYIATLCLFRTEGDLVRRLRYKSLSYTRFVDDITISSKISRFDFSHALSQTKRMLEEADLPVNAAKTKLQFSSIMPLLVHGLRVDFERPRLPPKETGRIRAAVKNLELLAATPGYRASRAYRKDFNRCMGRVNKLARVGHNQHPVLVDRLRKILPLPSHADIGRAEQLIKRLQDDLARPNYQASFWFYKRFHVASERLGILKRSFPAKALELRQRLSGMQPKFHDD